MTLQLILRTLVLILWVLPGALTLPAVLFTGTPLPSLPLPAILISAALLFGFRALRWWTMQAALTRRLVPVYISRRR